MGELEAKCRVRKRKLRCDKRFSKQYFNKIIGKWASNIEKITFGEITGENFCGRIFKENRPLDLDLFPQLKAVNFGNSRACKCVCEHTDPEIEYVVCVPELDCG